MPNKSYDLFANGLDQVIADLQKYENDLRIANDEFTELLADETISIIRSYANSNDPIENQDIMNENIKQRFESGIESSISVINTSQNATYSEFGYGIVGKSNSITTDPFGGDKFNAKPFDKWKYDVKNHGFKGWNYRNKFGWFQRSYGQIPKRTMYRSYLRIERESKGLARRIFNKIKLG